MSDLTDAIADAYSGVKGFATDAFSLWGDYQKMNLNIVQQQAAIDVAKTSAQTQAALAKQQAAYQLQIAQAGMNGSAAFDSLGLSTTIGNMQRLAAGQGSGNNLMMWLTVAGLAIAWLTYVKR